MHIATHEWLPANAIDREHEQHFLRTVFLWMCAGLLMTATVATWVAFSSAAHGLIERPGLIPMTVTFELVLVLVLAPSIGRLTPVAAAAVFAGYSLLNGLTLGGAALVYADTEIFQAFAVAAAMFGVMALYGLLTRKDLSSLGSLAIMGLSGLILASLVNVVVRSTPLAFAIDVVCVLVFAGLTAWNVQELTALADERRSTGGAAAIVGALALYVDLIGIVLRRRRRSSRA